MPYRRLPNTDTARIRAMKIALQKGKDVHPTKLAYSGKTIIRVQRFLPLFEQNIQLQKQAVSSQNSRCKNYNEIVKKAKIYLTHFIRVMNMSIFRGDLPEETRAYYGLATNESTIPSFSNENELKVWGRRIIEGEENRLRKGGSPITNPTIAVVKIRFEGFLEACSNQSILEKKTHDYTERTAELRREADEIVLQIWNEVEATYSNLTEEIRKKECEEYGLIYFYRKNELKKKEAEKTEAQKTLAEKAEAEKTEAEKAVTENIPGTITEQQLF